MMITGNYQNLMKNSFKARSSLEIDGKQYEIYRIDALNDHCDLARLPYCFKILAENLLRLEDDTTITQEDILVLANHDPHHAATRDIAFTPSRVVMQDFTGVPALVDLAVMRDAMTHLGGDPRLINPASACGAGDRAFGHGGLFR